jgi:uncharacterized protein YcbX
MEVGRLKSIYRYPVKSMGGESLDAVEIDRRGMRGDRAWAVRDEVRGGIRGAKKIPALMGLRARYLQPPGEDGSSVAEITLPNGDRVLSSAVDAGERITQAIDHAVTLWPLVPAETLDHYRRGEPTHEDLERELRSIFGRTEDEPLPDLTLFPPELMEFESPPGSYFDAFPLNFTTEATLSTVQKLLPQSKIDVRRFRPNFTIETEATGSAFPEQEWRGKRLRIGELTLAVTVECPRCVMTTHGFDDLPKDPQIMRGLVREAGGNLGVYATVEEPGTVRVGDPVNLID